MDLVAILPIMAFEMTIIILNRGLPKIGFRLKTMILTTRGKFITQ